MGLKMGSTDVLIIKDPLYGYIELEDQYAKIINKPEFQRLRNIRQTGYQALYPSALRLSSAFR